MFSTPILFLIFNRPDTTIQVFERIREVKPKQLFVAADGPRDGNEGDEIFCKEAREIATNVDWDCEVKTLIREENLGCRKAVSQAISWFFENVEEGIILEDDTLPVLSFFSYCRNMLDLYRGDRRIMVVSGNNFQEGRIRGNASYYFSRYTHIWGWATWRSAWVRFEENCEGLEQFVLSSQFRRVTNSQDERNYWANIFRKIEVGAIDSWDYVWHYHVWKNDGIVVLPNTNLVSNIGFGEGATHTKEVTSRWSNLPAKNLDKIVHPKIMEVNKKADMYTFRKVYLNKSWISCFRKFGYKIIKKLMVKIIQNNKFYKKLLPLLIRKRSDESDIKANQKKLIDDLQFAISYILKDKIENNVQRFDLITELKGTTPIEAFYIIHALHQAKEIDGDICELGIAQGNTSILIANEVRDLNKKIWLFDSFEGLPKPTKEDELIDDIFNLGEMAKYEGAMAFPESLVRGKIKEVGLDENKINIVPGFIKEGYVWPKSLKSVSFAYIDFDFYLPIKLALEFLKSKISKGGIIIVDDYGFFSSGAKAAVDEFLENNNQDYTYELPIENLSCFIIIKKK